MSRIGKLPIEIPSGVTITVDPDWITVAARHDLFANTFNETVVMRPGQYLTRFLVWLDNVGVDDVVRGSAAAVGGLSGRLRRTQTGFVRSYAMSMFGGAVLVVGALLLVRAG